MALGLRRAIVIVIAAIALLGALSPNDAVYSTSASFTAMYRSINDAVIDSYVVDTLLDPSQRIGATQSCVNTDNSIGSRPSVLANPPLAEQAIAQRKYLVATLAAYVVAIASIAEKAPDAETAIALGDLNRMAFELKRAANVHAQGDLFIEDPVSIVASAGVQLTAARKSNDARHIVLDTSPTVAKLLAILASDVAQRHNEADNATRRDYERWLTYYEAVRSASTNGVTKQIAAAPMPRCLVPAIPSTSAPSIANDVENDGANFAGRAAILARVETARKRYDAVRAWNPSPVLDCLSALNSAATKALSVPSAAADNTVAQAALRFRDAAQNLAGTLEKQVMRGVRE